MKKGFTLIETIVAFAIIAIILVVALVGFNTIARTDNRAQAWNVSDEALENIIATGSILDSAADSERFQSESDTFTITFELGGDGFEISGVIRTYTDTELGKSMSVFALH